MKIATVVIWFNPAIDFLKNIESYSKHVQKTIIVDNSSVDNSSLLNEYPHIEYIPLYKNIGIAAALNIGYQRALECEVEWVLTMDQDSWFDDQAISCFLNPQAAHFKQTKVAIFSPSVYKNSGDDFTDCNSVITSGSLVKLSAHIEISGYNEKLFIDQVDHEYCHRLRNRGHRILKLNNIYMHHIIGDPVSKIIFGVQVNSDNHNAIRKYYITRNVLYIRRHYSKSGGQHLKFILILIAKTIILEPDKFRKLLFIAKGVVDYMRNKMGPL